MTRWWSGAFANDPGFGVIDHADDRADDGLVRTVQGVGLLPGKVGAARRELDPHLRLRRLGLCVGQLADEGSLVAPFPPRLREVRADGPRRTADLIGERVRLLLWEALTGLEDQHGPSMARW